MTTLEQRTTAELDPVTRFVGDLSNLMSAAGDMIAMVGRNEPISSADQLRLRARLDLVEESLAGAGLAQVVPLSQPVHVDLGWATGGNTAVLTTMPVADVPVDGSVEVRPVGGQGRFGPWVHVIGEQERAVGGDENRSLLIDGVPEPFTWHLDQCVQVRPFRPVDEDLVEARHRAENGGL